MLGLLPPLEGLYRDDLVPPLTGAGGDFWSPFRSRPDYRDLLFVRPDIPVHSSWMTAFIAKAVQDSGRPSTAGVAYANPQTIQGGLLTGDRSQGYLWRARRFLDGNPEGSITDDNPFTSAACF
ncbi:MAG: hypothetical protein QW683_08915 [Candidatus Caldarchaeum sp.]